MNLSPTTKAWLLKGDPNRPDPGGLMKKARVELVARLEKTESLETLCGECQDTLRTLGFVALHGEHDQKTHGNRDGGPKVEGESKEAAAKLLNSIPAKIRKESKATFDVSPQGVSSKKIDDFLLKHYGFDMDGAATSLVDREHNKVFTTEDGVYSQFARTLTARIESPEWQKASKGLNDTILRSSPLKPEQLFTDAFTELFNSKPVMEVAKLSNPISRLLETDFVHDVFKQWGWIAH